MSSFKRRSSGGGGGGGGGCHECGSTRHRVAQCPTRNSRGGGCHECGSTSHRVADCPDRNTCRICGSRNHTGAACPDRDRARDGAAAAAASSAPAFRNAGAGGGCHECGSHEHRVAACPKRNNNNNNNNHGAGPAAFAAPLVCFACQRPGHFASECPTKQVREKIGERRYLPSECRFICTDQPAKSFTGCSSISEFQFGLTAFEL
jgi:hypothetical protein